MSAHKRTYAKNKNISIIWRLISRHRQITLLLVLILVSYIITPRFITLTNVFYLMRIMSIIGIAAFGMMTVVLTGGIDLSLGYIAALSCVLLAYFEHWGIYLGYVEELSFIAPLPVIYLMVLGVGVLIGSIYGYIIGKWKVLDFAITLGGAFILQGTSYIIPGGQTIFGVDEFTKFIGGGGIGIIPTSFIIWIIIGIVMYIVLRYTALGKSIYAYGGGAEASQLCGISPTIAKMGAYIICGVLAAFVGIIYAGRTDTGDYRVAGFDLMLNALMATLLGGVNIFGGEGGILGVMIGSAIVAIIYNIFDLTGLHPYPRDILRGIVLIIILIGLIKGERLRKI
ncbi:MAG: ABC transporter permease [Nitrososphaerota archaeon]